MKKCLAIILQVITFSVLHGQIPNAGMEFWDNEPRLLQWETNSFPLTDPPYEPYIVRQDTERYSGNYAANFWANGYFKAYAKTTFPLSAHPLSLSLYYKLSFAPCVNDPGFPETDTVSVLVEVLSNGSVVDQGYWESITTSFFYSQLVIPISQNATAFDSCRITIMGGKLIGGCGIIAASTEFKVDQLEMQYPSACNNTGVVVAGVEPGCLLINTGSFNFLLPCNVSLAFLGFSIGDTIHFSYTLSNCITTCQQGTTVDITCIDTGATACNMSVSLLKQNPSSYVANNGWLKAQVTGGTSPFFFMWSTGTNGSGVDSIGNLGDGNYCVTVSDANNCTASACDSLAGPHICIDSALMCIPPHLCCDAPLFDPVCGCDGVTYTNGCIATFLNGVTSYTQGACTDSCVAAFSFYKHIDTVTFYNASTSAVAYVWDFGDGNQSSQQEPVHIYLADSTYTVCLTIITSSGCTDTYCDSVFITHDCIDTSDICPHPLCCDFVPMIAVCGCDSVTYINACVAGAFYGVTRYYVGTCVSTGLQSGSSVSRGISVSPNPARNILNVTYETARPGKTEMRITNLLGQEVKFLSRPFETTGRHQADISIADLHSGVYILEVKTESDRKLKKFAVE